MSVATAAQPTITLDPANKVVHAVVQQVKSDMRGGAKYAAYVAEYNVTRENVKEHALAIARLVTPETAQTETVDGKKVRTRFGNAVQAAGNGLRSALEKKDGLPKNYLTALIKAAQAAAEHDVDVEAALKDAGLL